MKNLKKRKMDDDDELPIICMHHERYDADALAHIAQLELDPIMDIVVSKMNRKVNMPNKKGADRSTREQVDYRYAEDNGSLEGRVYGPNSLQTLNGWIRRILGYKYYHDLDFENCAPMIISQVCIQFLGIVHQFCLNMQKRGMRCLKSANQIYQQAN